MAPVLDNKQFLKAYADAFRHPDTTGADMAVQHHFAQNAQIHVCHPFNTHNGPKAYIDNVLTPLRAAFAGLHRRDDILIGGDFEGAEWVSATGYYAGKFVAPFLGIDPTDALAYLRFGEFHRISHPTEPAAPYAAPYIVESYIYLDLPQLMIAAGQWPIENSPGRDRGYTGYTPGPASHDGLQLHINDAKRSTSSVAMVTEMLRKLATDDEAWRPYWHDNMAWYGPAAFGSFLGVEEFAGFQVPFEQAFSHWSGGAAGNGVTVHATRFADGDYICTAGWPSLLAVQAKPFLGQPSSGDALLMRVSDWWRRDGDLLVENWVFVDIPDVLLQMGVDLFAGHHKVAPGPRLDRLQVPA